MVIDRIEGDIAVVEFDGQTLDIPVSYLPSGAQEGDVLRLEFDPNAASKREAEDRIARLQAKDDQPDHIDL